MSLTKKFFSRIDHCKCSHWAFSYQYSRKKFPQNLTLKPFAKIFSHECFTLYGNNRVLYTSTYTSYEKAISVSYTPTIMSRTVRICTRQNTVLLTLQAKIGISFIGRQEATHPPLADLWPLPPWYLDCRLVYLYTSALCCLSPSLQHFSIHPFDQIYRT